MSSTLFLYLSLLGACILSSNALPGFPDKIYGVNIGSWCVFVFLNALFLSNEHERFRLVLEPWMLPAGIKIGTDLEVLSTYLLYAYRMGPHGRRELPECLLYMHRNWVVSYILIPRPHCLNYYASVPLLRPALILSTKNLRATGNSFVSRRLIEVDVSKKIRQSWFNQEDVNQLVDAGMNTVRIPVRALLAPQYSVSCDGLTGFCSLAIGSSSLWWTGLLNSILREALSNSYVTHSVL